MNHEEYLKRRAELLAIRDDSFEAFDKSILTLSTGCLALSITFLDRIGRPFNKVTFFLIFASWVAFLTVLVSNLASYLFAKSNMDRKIEEIDNKYKKELETNKADDAPETVFWQNKATGFCNNFAFIVFCIGVLTILTYVSLIQINNYSVMKESHKETRVMSENKKTQINEGKIEGPKAVTTTVDITKGKTEVSQAVVRPSKTTLGKTESPQDVIKPVTPEEKK
jgi:hypothetical protein